MFVHSKGLRIVCFGFALVFLAGLVGFSVIQDKKDGAKAPNGLPSSSGSMDDTKTFTVPYVGPQPVNPAPQEKAGAPFLIPPIPNNPNNPLQNGTLSAAAGLTTGKDIRAMFSGWGSINFDSYANSLYMDERGVLFCAYEAPVGGNPANEKFIEIDYSTNGGLTWAQWGWVWKTGINLTQPSIYCTNDTVILAYVVNESGKDPYVETGYKLRTTISGVLTPVSIYHDTGGMTMANEVKPYLFGDHEVYSSSSSAYLIYEHQYDATAKNINILFQRTGDDGATWKDFSYIFGTGVADEYRMPRGCFGDTTSHYLYIVGYNKTTKTVVLRRSTDWGVSFAAQQNLTTLALEPGSGDGVNPSIAASHGAGTTNALIYFIKGTASNGNDIYYLYSVNSGSTWLQSGFTGSTTNNDVGPLVWAGPNGDNFHIFWTEGDSHIVKYISLPQSFTGGYSSGIIQVNRGGLASWSYSYAKGVVADWKFDFPQFLWIDYSYDSPYYHPYFNRLVPDDLVGTWDGQGVYYRTDGGNWILLASPAEQVAAGDLTGAGDGTADLLGVWAAQGFMCKRSDTGAWVYLGTSPRDIAYGNMNGGAYGEVVGTWDGQGVFYKTTLSGSWIQMATPADMITAGDLDGDGIDDLIGVWAAQAGVWVKYSQTGTWTYIGSTPRHIATGDMDGDGRADLVGTWDGQGVYWRKSQTGAWTYLGTPASLITTADMDGDGKSDIVGIWPSQAGVWTKYSSTNQWEYLSTAVRDLSSGKMRAGAHTWGAQAGLLLEPVGGQAVGAVPIPTEDYSANSPGMPGFIPAKQPNLVPVQDPMIQVVPGPGMRGFKYETTPNPVPIMSVKKAAKGGAEKSKY